MLQFTSASMERKASKRLSFGSAHHAVALHQWLIIKQIALKTAEVNHPHPNSCQRCAIACISLALCFRGLVYCSHCGFYAAHAVRKLKAPCGEGLEVCPTQQGLANLTRIGQGKLPVSLSAWPAHTPPYLSNPVPMPISTACASSAPLLSLSTT